MRAQLVVSVAALCGVFVTGGAGCSSETPQDAPIGTTHSLQELTVSTPANLPPCNNGQQGSVAYVQSNSTLYACVDVGSPPAWTWTPITIPMGPTGATGATGARGATGATG